MLSLTWAKRHSVNVLTAVSLLHACVIKGPRQNQSRQRWIQISGHLRGTVGLKEVQLTYEEHQGARKEVAGRTDSFYVNDNTINAPSTAVSGLVQSARESQVPRHDIIRPDTVLPVAPSEILVSSLRSSGYHFALPKLIANKVDLSYVNPRSSRLRQRTSMKRVIQERTGKELIGLAAETSLQGILARYIRAVTPVLKLMPSSGDINSEDSKLDNELLRIFDDATLRLLHSRKYDIADIMNWSWIITAQTSEHAALRLMILSNIPYREGCNPVPAFIYLFLLRRHDISPRALKILIVHAWDRLRNRKNKRWAVLSAIEIEGGTNLNTLSDDRGHKPEAANYSHMSETTVVTMIVRLLRHARRVLPAAIISVASILTTYIDGVGSRDFTLSNSLMSETISARLTFLYNRVLSLLSFPSSQHPMRSIPYHQRAQFNVIRRMSQFEPPLTIVQEGYRAITRVQLAHRKTLREREWGDLKAKSWPPWKEEKTGLDVDKGIEMGISRAKESLYRLNEAGYSTREWENSASILAGWDTDNSPTIQTRAIIPGSLSLRMVTSRGDSNHQYDPAIWAARVRATRTVNEGWACFIACGEHEGNTTPRFQNVYHAMFEKLVFESKRQRNRNVSKDHIFEPPHSSEQPSLPGDGKEVVPLPVSPRVAIYVPKPPPSVQELFDSMIGHGILPSGRCLAFLISHADSLSTGLMYLRSSSLPASTIKVLIRQERSLNSTLIQKALKVMPDYLFASYIYLLTRFSLPAVRKNTRANRHQSQIIAIMDDLPSQLSESLPTCPNPLLHAFRLVSARMPYYLPPWKSLLAALARSGTSLLEDGGSQDADAHDISNWSAVLKVLHQMREIGLDIDFDIFQVICIGLEKAVHASHRLLAATRKPSIMRGGTMSGTAANQAVRSRVDAEEVLDVGIRTVKILFKRLTDSEHLTQIASLSSNGVALPNQKNIDPASLLPRLWEVPAPAQLHVFVRTLGLAQDYEGLQTLIIWMARFAPELQAVADEMQKGSRLMRRTLVAVRVFAERSWLRFGSDEDIKVNGQIERSDKGVPEGVLQIIYDSVESVESWGGWPTDAEVKIYCQNGKFS